MQLPQIVMDTNGREIASRGTPLFPLSVHDNDMHAFPSHFVPWHWHAECELLYVAEGEMLLETPGQRTVLGTGCGAYINANVLHAMRPQPASPCRMITIDFDAAVLGGSPASVFQTKYVLPVLHDDSFPECILDQAVPWARETVRLLKQIREAHDAARFGFELRIRNLLSDVWMQLMENAETMPQNVPEPDPYIKQLLSFVHANYAEDLTLESIAASAGISGRTCSRSFRRQVHMSVFAYVLEYRLKMAAEQLALSEMSVAEVCYACGFRDPSYFTRRFRDRTGLTPKDYRRAARQKAPVAGT